MAWKHSRHGPGVEATARCLATSPSFREADMTTSRPGRLAMAPTPLFRRHLAHALRHSLSGRHGLAAVTFHPLVAGERLGSATSDAPGVANTHRGVRMDQR